MQSGDSDTRKRTFAERRGTKVHCEFDGRVSRTALGPSPCMAKYGFQVGLLMSLGLAVSNVTWLEAEYRNLVVDR